MYLVDYSILSFFFLLLFLPHSGFIHSFPFPFHLTSLSIHSFYSSFLFFDFVSLLIFVLYHLIFYCQSLPSSPFDEYKFGSLLEVTRSRPTSLSVIPNVSVTVGSDVELWCIFFTVDEDTSYWWYREKEAKINSSLYKKVLIPEENPGLEQIKHILTLRNVSRKDEGWYWCSARNNIGSSISETYLRVIGIGRYISFW